MHLDPYDPHSGILLMLSATHTYTHWSLWQKPKCFPAGTAEIWIRKFIDIIVRYMSFERQLLALIDTASMSKWHKIKLKPEIAIMSWVISEKHSNKEDKRMTFSLNIVILGIQIANFWNLIRWNGSLQTWVSLLWETFWPYQYDVEMDQFLVALCNSSNMLAYFDSYISSYKGYHLGRNFQ